MTRSESGTDSVSNLRHLLLDVVVPGDRQRCASPFAVTGGT
jgi:hypothetical protein